MKTLKNILIWVLAICAAISMAACGAPKDDVVIYTSLLDYRREYLQQRLAEEFPQYKIRIEYLSTGNHAAKLLAEGTDTACDITTDLEWGYMQKLDANGILADLSAYDHSIYVEDAAGEPNILPKERNGNAIIINRSMLEEKGIAAPESYEDLLKPEFEGLISIPNPKASSSGYVLLKSLVNAWGEEEAFAYFDKLSANVQHYPSSGSGAVNAVIQGEAVVGYGIISDAVREIGNGAPIDIIFFEEGAPHALYGQSIIKGKESRPEVKEVFDFLVNVFDREDMGKFSPEKIYKDVDFELDNFPKNIHYSNMSDNTPEEKDRLLNKWKY